MKLNIKQALRALIFVPVLAFAVSAAMPVQDVSASSVSQGADAARDSSSQKVPNLTGNNGLFNQVTNVLLYIIGAISVIMIVVGGIRYTISNGDSNQITAAKNTIMYAVIGLVVAILAYAIVNYVVTAF